MFRKVLSVLLVIAVLLTSLVGLAAPVMAFSSGGAIPGDMLGFSMPDPVNYSSEGDITKEFDMCAETGAKWVRCETYWCEIATTQPTNQEDPNDPAYDWTTYDLFFKTAKDNGQDVIWIVRGAPIWASAWPGHGDHDTAPADEATYGNFCKALVLRYMPQAKAAGLKMAVEFWNEPNMGYFYPWSNPTLCGDQYDIGKQAYMNNFVDRVIKPGFTGVRSALAQLGNDYSPADCQTLAGGLAGAVGDYGSTTSPETTVEYWYQHGVKGYFDAISTHPYAFSDSSIYKSVNEVVNSQGFIHLRATRDVMLKYGDSDKKIWATEIGVPTNNTSNGMVNRRIPEAAQPNYVKWDMDTWFSYDYTGPMIWFNGRDIQTGSTEENFNYGLFHTDWTLKPAYDTFASRVSASKPDLVVTDVKCSPEYPGIDEEVTFSAIVINRSSVAVEAGNGFKVTFNVDGNVVNWSDNYTQSIPAGGSATITATGGPSGKSTWKAITGTHSVQATVDSEDSVAEKNENNNSYTKEIIPGTPPRQLHQ